MTLNEKINQLENRIKELEDIISKLSSNINNSTAPYTILGGQPDSASVRPIDPSSGLGRFRGNNITWNNLELNQPLGEIPANPENYSNSVGYNKHSHSRFSGGALIKGVVEVIEYDPDSIQMRNPHSQSYWLEIPEIMLEENSQGIPVPKIGKLDLVFNPDTRTWGCPAYEIDIEKCFFVKRNEHGEIETDEYDQPMKAPLYHEDPAKTSIVWDKDAGVWRLYSVFAPPLEEAGGWGAIQSLLEFIG